MIWLWQGIITSFVCYLLSKFFSFMKKCILSYYHYEKSISSSKVVFKLFWKTYFCVLINSLIMSYIIYHVDFKNSVPFGVFILLIFTANNLFLFYSVDNVKNKFTYKKKNKVTKQNSNQIQK